MIIDKYETVKVDKKTTVTKEARKPIISVYMQDKECKDTINKWAIKNIRIEDQDQEIIISQNITIRNKKWNFRQSSKKSKNDIDIPKIPKEKAKVGK